MTGLLQCGPLWLTHAPLLHNNARMTVNTINTGRPSCLRVVWARNRAVKFNRRERCVMSAAGICAGVGPHAHTHTRRHYIAFIKVLTHAVSRQSKAPASQARAWFQTARFTYVHVSLTLELRASAIYPCSVNISALIYQRRPKGPKGRTEAWLSDCVLWFTSRGYTCGNNMIKGPVRRIVHFRIL